MDVRLDWYHHYFLIICYYFEERGHGRYFPTFKHSPMAVVSPKKVTVLIRKSIFDRHYSNLNAFENRVLCSEFRRTFRKNKSFFKYITIATNNG